MLTFPDSPSSDVLILGAGFSKALSEAMPLTDDLGEAVLPLMRKRTRLPVPRTFRRGQFENWLSRLSDEQPDLDTAENLANHLLFQLASESLAEVLADQVLRARGDVLGSDWLLDLLGILHIRRSTLLTFNQDTLIEIAVTHARLSSWIGRTPRGQLPNVTWWDVLNGQPARPPTQWDSFRSIEQTFRVLKLHGSIHWYWQPGDASGATVASWVPQGIDSADPTHPEERAAIHRWLPNRVPLIVPPTAGKNAFYRIPLLTQLWQDARKAMLAPNLRISLLGYSIPPTDLVTTGLLKEVLGGRSDIALDVVNPRPRQVSKNIRALGVAGRHIRELPTIRQFVAEYQDRAATDLVAAVRAADHDNEPSLLLVGSGLDGSLKVVAIALAQGGDVELILQDDVHPYTATNVMPGDQSVLVTTQQLVEIVEDEKATRIVAIAPDGRRLVVVGATTLIAGVGSGNGRWQVMLTAQSPGKRLN